MNGELNRLPNVEQAIIEPLKLHGYLLSLSHPLGRFKALFFAALGFDAPRWHELETAFREQHLNQPAESVDSNKYGEKFEIRAMLKGPNGRSALVSSIWMIATDEHRPRFITAYPAEER
ncbi:MAG: DUF6883 domain-containing protein [Terriglobales bacterium]